MSRKKVTLIDPLFTIPEGAEDSFEYTRDRLDDEVYDEGQFTPYDVIISVDEGEVGELATPDVFEIISQTVRVGTGNSQVVDVVFETEVIIGATKYEIQVTKV